MKKIFNTINKSKKNKIISIALLLICIAAIAIITIIIISKSNAQSIVGRWCYSEGRAICYNFNADQTGTYGTTDNKNSFKYTANNNTLHVDYDSDNITMADVTYKIENDALILTTKEGKEAKYIKEEPEAEQPQESQEKQDRNVENDEEMEKDLEEERKREEELHEQELREREHQEQEE